MRHYGLDDYDTDLQLFLAFFPPLLSLTCHCWAKQLARKHKRRAFRMHAPCPTVRRTRFLYRRGGPALAQELFPGALCPRLSASYFHTSLSKSSLLPLGNELQSISILHGNGEDTGLEKS